jgi:exodeoxyribonuclease VII small subunit
MKTDLTYSAAYAKLEELVAQLEDGNIPLDELSLKVKQANELISICENKLRNIQTEVNETIKGVTKGQKKEGSGK